MLKRKSADEVALGVRVAFSDAARESARAIVKEVAEGGIDGLRRVAVRLGDVDKEDAKIIFTKADMKAAFDGLSSEQQSLLTRTAERICAFAEAQKAALKNAEISIPGGRAGHTVAPVEVAGCYAPGGRYPLPSSVLMTACSARVAGVSTVWVASPKPLPVTLAAAHVANADAFLGVGGAHAIAALAYGCSDVIPSCDCIVGPGNQYVTAAKAIVAERVTIDQLAGPSECLVLADESADPAVVAADMLAQAEHDVQAMSILVTMSEDFVKKVEKEVEEQLDALPTAGVAREAIKESFAVVVPDMETAIKVCDKLAPEHLEVHLENARDIAPRLAHYGGLFIGHAAAEVLGDYGAGPNHTLPTGGTARSTGGLSVLTFLRVRTWIEIDDAKACQQLVEDAVALGEMEGLIGHARAAARRRIA